MQTISPLQVPLERRTAATTATVCAASTCCACARRAKRRPAAAAAAGDVVAAPSGTFADANANARSGSSAMSVPIARMPKPNQIQLTSGLTVTSSVALCCSASKPASTTYRSSANASANRDFGGRFFFALPLKNHFAGYIRPSDLPSLERPSICAVTICFWPSCGDWQRDRSCTVYGADRRPAARASGGPALPARSRRRAKPRKISTMPEVDDVAAVAPTRPRDQADRSP